MRELLLKINIKSILKVLLVAFPVIFVFQLILISGSSNYKNNISKLQAEQLSAINNLESPAEMKIGIVNSDTRYIVDSTTDTVSEIINNNSDMLCSAGMSVSIRYAYSCYKTKSNLNNIGTSLSDYSTLVIPALNFLEYNPQVDFSNYSPGATNTTDRIKSFKQGVENTKNDYKNIGYPDESTIKIINLLDESLLAVEKLEQTDNVNEFSNTIIDKQKQIVSLLENNYNEVTVRSRQLSIDILKEFK